MEEGLFVTFKGDASGLVKAADHAAHAMHQMSGSVSEAMKSIPSATAVAITSTKQLAKELEGSVATWQQLNAAFHGIFHGKSGDDSLGAQWQKIKAGQITVSQFVESLQLTDKQLAALPAKLEQVGLVAKGAFSGAAAGAAHFHNAASTPVRDPFKPLVKGSNQANMALINLSRVAQDAPFGIIGIANNLDPLLASFQGLKKETGSFGGAMKALGAGLLGPAGLGIGLSVATSLMIAFGDKLFDSKSASEAAAAAIEKQKKALEQYQQTLSDVDKVRLAGAQNAQEELVKLQSLYSATQNANLSYVERKKAVDALQEQYPKYFKNLSDEAVLAGKGKDAYDKLSNAILASARARAAQDQLVEIQKQLLTIERQRVDARRDEINASNNLNQSKKDEITLQKQVIGGGTAQASLMNNSVLIAQENLNNKSKKTVDLTKQWVALNERARRLTGEIQLNVETNGVDAITEGLKGKLPKVKEAKIEFPLSFDFIDIDWSKDVPKIFQRQSIAEEFTKTLKKQFEGQSESLGILDNPEDILERILFQYETTLGKLGARMPKTVTVDGVEVDIKDIKPSANTNKQVEESLKEFQRKVEASAAGVSNAMNAMFSGSFTSIGESLGQALAAGDVTSGLDVITSFLGDAISQIGKALIEYGVVKEGLDKILKGGIAIPGIAAIAIGAAAVAAGALIKKSKVQPFAAGGLAFGPALGLVGEGAGTSATNPEVIAPLDKLKKFINPQNGGSVHVTGRLRGNDMVLQNSRTTRKQRRVR